MDANRIAAAVVLACVTVAAQAAQRTFVSTSGNDANVASNCSLAAPCRSFGAALTATDAGGEIIVLDSGGYGIVTIDRAVTIEAPAGVYAGISVFAPDDGIVVNAAGAKVTLRGLSINGQGGNRGVVLTAADTLRVERCRISGMSGRAIQGAGAGSRLHVYDTLIADNDSFGIDLNSGAELIVERVRIERSTSSSIETINVASIVVRDSTLVGSTFGNGLSFVANSGNSADVVIDGVVIADNGNSAFNAFANTGSAIAASIMRSQMVRNGTVVSSNGTIRANSNAGSTQVSVDFSTVQRNFGSGVNALGAGTRVTVSNSTVVGNTGVGLQNQSATLYTRGNNTIRGNNGAELVTQTSGVITALGGS